MIELRWLVESDGSDVKKLQYRNWQGIIDEPWITVPTAYHVKDTTESVSTLPQLKE